MKKLVFVGGGHAHLPALKQARSFLRAGAEVTLVAPSPYHYYSGMGPGILGGTYHPAQARIAVKRLILSRGGQFVDGKVVGIDPRRHRLTLDDGKTLDYDFVSFNTGSRVPSDAVVSDDSNAVAVKPIENLLQARQILLRRGSAHTRILIIGGGPGGVELAGNLHKLAREHSISAHLTVVDAAPRLLSQMPEKAARIAQQVLQEKGTHFLLETGIREVRGNVALTETGQKIPFDLAFLTLGIIPHTLYADSGLATGPQGGMRVNSYLQAIDYPGIYGGGDCVSLTPLPLPRVGVYAIRQGPILFQNLFNSIRGLPPIAFRPQKRYLLILNLGDGTGLAVWGPLVWRSRLAFHWKNHLDLSFMRHFQLSGELSEIKGHTDGHTR